MKNLPMILGTCVLALTVSAGEVRAQTAEENAQACQHGTGHSDDEIIASCTALINSGQGDASARSDAFGQRGAAYEREKRNDDAIADYHDALQLNPDNMAVEVVLDDLVNPDPD